jgi:hypothetical protein
MTPQRGQRKAQSGQVPSFRESDQTGQQRPGEKVPPTGTEVSEGWFTQYGTTNEPFRNKPRFDENGEFDVSMFRGKLTLSETVNAMLGRPPAAHHRHRHFDVAKLVAASYRCLHTPSRRRPTHASILASCAATTIAAHKAWWAALPKHRRLDALAESG